MLKSRNTQSKKENNADNILLIIAGITALWIVIEILRYLNHYNLNPFQSELSRLGNDRLNELGLKKYPTIYLLLVIITSMFLRLIWLFKVFSKKISSFLLFYVGQLISIAISFKTNFFIRDNNPIIIIQILILIIFSITQRKVFDNIYSPVKQIILSILSTLALHLCFAHIIDFAQNSVTEIENLFFSFILFLLMLSSILSLLKILLGDFKKIYFYLIVQVLIIILYSVNYIINKSIYEDYPETIDKIKMDYFENIAPIVLLMMGFSFYIFRYVFRKDKESLKMIESIGT